MAGRKITVHIDEALSPDDYADLAHAIWSVTYLTSAKSGFSIEVDDLASSEELQKRWEDVGAQYPWA